MPLGDKLSGGRLEHRVGLGALAGVAIRLRVPLGPVVLLVDVGVGLVVGGVLVVVPVAAAAPAVLRATVEDYRPLAVCW